MATGGRHPGRPGPALPPVAARTVVKLVSGLPRAGASRVQGDAIVNGIRLAIAEQNGQAGKFSIAYEDWDDASPQKGDWDPDLEAANARRAVSDPDEGYAVNGYVVAQVALKALVRAGQKSREAVRQAMVGLGQVDGALGTWQFDGNGDTSLATISVSTVKDGCF